MGLCVGGAVALFWMHRREEPLVAPVVVASRPVSRSHSEQSTPHSHAPSNVVDTPVDDDLPLGLQGSRPASEWQGMPQDARLSWPCEGASGCGLARACVEGRCVPCSDDSQCGSDEGCVLEHCLLTEAIDCRVAAECDDDELCVLSGYAATPRGNEGMRAFCRPSSGGSEEGPEDPAPGVLIGSPPTENDWRGRVSRELADREDSR